MAGIASEEPGVERSLEAISSEQLRCQSGEALVEWRSSEQLENEKASTSPPYWDTDDDDDCGPKPSELYGKYTWKIDKFSQINKRELRSNAFEVGGYKWYVLIYPQGCDVCNHLSLFLCVANHDKLLPGWSHFAQFTIAVVNKDPKKSKYSDTLHRFWKKEHDWGWKKFMELSKVLDGFIDADTLIIKAQVQVIRERVDRPFRCLDCQYRRELVRVYLTNVQQICRRFMEDRRNKLLKLIEDKARWSSFCAFWLGIDQNARRHMSREKADALLKVVVKHFFVEKEVTSTLVMDSLYSGLKALEGQTKSKKGWGKLLDPEELPVHIVRIEKDMFVLVDDVLQLLERAVIEPLPPKDDKGPQNRMKDGCSGEDFNKDSIVHEERNLTELGCKTIEIFVLAHIFSKIEVAYQEAVALKRQEELIREEEAAWLAESGQKVKRRAAEKEKKSKKKQGKQKRSNRKVKDKEKSGRPCLAVEDKFQQESSAETEAELVVQKPDTQEDVSDASDSVDCVSGILQPDLEERDVSPVNWDTDTSEVHPLTEASGSGASALSVVQNDTRERNSPRAVDDSSSTCSTDSVPSVVPNGPYEGNSLPNQQSQKSPSRVRNYRGRTTSDQNLQWTYGVHRQPSESKMDTSQLNDAPESCKAGAESEAAVPSLHNRIKQLEQHVVKKEKAVVSLRRVLSTRDQADMERPCFKEKATGAPDSPSTPSKYLSSSVQVKSESRTAGGADSVSIRKPYSERPQIERPALQGNSAGTTAASKSDAPNAVTAKTSEKHLVMSRPFSAPIVPGPRPTVPVITVVQTTPPLARSVSAAGRLGPDPSPATHSYVPQSYRNAMMATPVPVSSAGFAQPPSPSSAGNPLQSYTQLPNLTSPQIFISQSLEMVESNSKPGLSFGRVNHDALQNGSQWLEHPQRDGGGGGGSSSRSVHPSSLHDDIHNLDFYRPVDSRSHKKLPTEFPAGTSGRQAQSVLADEFPHLDIINDLLDDEQGITKVARASTGFQSFSNGPHHLNRQFTFPGDVGLSNDMAPSTTSSCRFERTRSYHGDGLRRGSHGSLGGSHCDSLQDMIPQANPLPYSNGQIEGLILNQWQMGGSDMSYPTMRRNIDGDGYLYHQIPDYSNLASSVNGYTVFRPSNGH